MRVSLPLRRAGIACSVGLLLVAFVASPAHATPDPWGFKQTIVRNADGRLEEFTNFGGEINHRWELRPYTNEWSGWESLGDGNMRGYPAATQNVAGQLHVFAVEWGLNNQNRLKVKWQVSPGGGWTSTWFDMGGFLTSNPAAILNCDGRMELFGRGLDNAIWTKWQYASGGWSSWASIYGQAIDFPRAEHYDCQVDVYVTGTDNQTWVNSRYVYGGSWSGWVLIWGINEANSNRPASDPR